MKITCNLSKILTMVQFLLFLNLGQPKPRKFSKNCICGYRYFFKSKPTNSNLSTEWSFQFKIYNTWKYRRNCKLRLSWFFWRISSCALVKISRKIKRTLIVNCLFWGNKILISIRKINEISWNKCGIKFSSNHDLCKIIPVIH